MVSLSSCSGSCPTGARTRQARIEPADFADRGDPVGDVVHLAGREAQAFGFAQLDETDGTVVDRVAGDVEARLDHGIVEVDHITRGGRAGEQHTGLLEALADRRDPVGQPARVDLQQLARRGVAQSVAHAFHRQAGVDVVQPTAREHVHAAAEHGLQRAPQHEHLEAVASPVAGPVVSHIIGRVADQHDRRGGPDRHSRRIERVLH